MDARFVDHYNRELTLLREMGGEFAKQYPAVAGRLGLDEFQCQDPYVERLLEGFAFLAARVHRRLDAEFPEFTHGLLDTLYPHFTRPLPSASIFCLHPDQDEGSLAEGYQLPRGTQVVGPTSDQSPTPCRFETTDELTLWPLAIENVALQSRDSSEGRACPETFKAPNIRSFLRVHLKTTAGLKLSALKLDQLKLHLRGSKIAHHLYELLMARTVEVAVRDENSKSWSSLGPSAFSAEGLQNSQSLLPQEPRSFSGYRLLQEYLLLPEKFLFASIGGLKSVLPRLSGQKLELLIALSDFDSELASQVRSEHLALHCVPAINLFRKRTDRILVNDRRHEQLLVVDRSRPLDYEVWSVEEVRAHTAQSAEDYPVLPLYAPPGKREMNSTAPTVQAMFYTAQRRERLLSTNQRQYGNRSSYYGSEVYLSLSDSTTQLPQQDVRQLSATVYCTNRDLALIAPVGGWRDAFRLTGPGPVNRVECITGPTRPRDSLTASREHACWKLIRHLTPNLLTFGAASQEPSLGNHSAAMLREMWAIYCTPDQPAQQRSVEAIRDLRQTLCTKQLPLGGPIVHGRGVELELHLDENSLEGSSAFLMATVLEQVFARFVSLNSFVQLTLCTNERGKIFSWPIRMGDISCL